MPNIMFFGFTHGQYRQLKDRVDAIMQDIGLGNDAVTTFVFPSVVESCDGKRTSQPYICLCTTGSPEEADRIISALRQAQIGLDCEIMLSPRNGFIPAAQMKTS